YYRSTVHHVPGGYLAVPILALMLGYLCLRPAIDAAVESGWARLLDEFSRRGPAEQPARQPATGDALH
ncbi:MAG TPA: hypothetical protein VH951_07945, partial [Dehalococcoidia bacterium]